MFERFNESAKAAEFVAAGLRNDFPDALAEVIQVIKNRPRRVSCTVAEIEALLLSACKGFPKASVDYHPENPYGFVAEIRCHGERSRSTKFERHKRERPRVLVLLTRVAGKEVLVGSHMPPKPRETAKN